MADVRRNNSGEFRWSPPVAGKLKIRNGPPVDVQVSSIGGQSVFEGDILIGRQLDVLGIAITGLGVLWPGGQIPFVIDQDFDNPTRVRDAIQHWETHTSIRFVAKKPTDRDAVRFSNGDGCASAVGRIGGVQIVTLGPSCSSGNAIHEIGHVVGLWHEQSRKDRDQHVRIVRENIDEDALHNFDQHITDGQDIDAYDYGSIMHYSANAFAKDPTQPTIVTPNGQKIGQRDALSAGDLATVKKLYGGA